MGRNVAQKLIESHLVFGKMFPGEEIGLKIDQTLTQDATGTLVMLELEAMKLQKVKTELSAQYVDHNLLETDFKNADDHVFLQSACERFGIHYSPAGNGVSHPVHMELFGIPGKTLLGSDSHTCAAGSMGMLAIGSGGLSVALAMAGRPFYLSMPKIWGVRLTGKLPDWVSAKDVILEMLRRHGVDGGTGKIIEYYGPGLEGLSAMDRHVLANMGAELGATTSVFPSDSVTKRFLKQQHREKDWKSLAADPDGDYDLYEELDLSKLEPLIALPGSPDNVVPVSEVVGTEVYQCMVGSSANPGLRDFAVPALMLKDRRVHPRVSLDINPTSRQILENMTHLGYLGALIHGGARIHQTGCNGCIGMGQAPATGRVSLRTVPRNFPGRSGTKDDKVYLCSPEVAIAAALTGVITDPRTLEKTHGMKPPIFCEPETFILNREMVVAPKERDVRAHLEMGPNIKPLPEFGELEHSIEGPVLLKVRDNMSTDGILPAGNKVLPFRSNIPEISKFTFSQVDETFYERAMKLQKTGSVVVGGANYGQGSSREHAALVCRYLGVKAVIAKGYARIHRMNLYNFGVVPLLFEDENDWDKLELGDVLSIQDLRKALGLGAPITVRNKTKETTFKVKHNLSKRELNTLLSGGLINHIRRDHTE